MVFIRSPGSVTGLYASREHIFPASTHEAKGMKNNIVLAHSACNQARGAPSYPSPSEILKGREIYAKLGMRAFIVGVFSAEESAYLSRLFNVPGHALELNAKALSDPGLPKFIDIWPGVGRPKPIKSIPGVREPTDG